MCCSTGVCGVDVDPVLVQFAADPRWAAEQGIEVKRYNLGQEPQAFAASPAVLKEMEAGMERLPVIVIDGSIAATGAHRSLNCPGAAPSSRGWRKRRRVLWD